MTEKPDRATLPTSIGVLYIAFGEYYVAEAIHSAQSLRQLCPQIPTVLFTNEPVQSDAFTELRLVGIDHIRAKVDLLAQTPFERTLYLDSDTRVVRDISDLFGLLDRFDVALAQDFARHRPKFAAQISEYGEIPYGFPEMNGGLVLYRNSPGTQAFLDMWRTLFYKYRDITNGWDQASLRIALWKSGVQVHTLPVEYNVRSAATRRRVDKLRSSVKNCEVMQPRILHWHGLHENKWWRRFSLKYRQYKF